MEDCSAGATCVIKTLEYQSPHTSRIPHKKQTQFKKANRFTRETNQPMKTISSSLLFTLVAFTVSGCFSYERRTPSRSVVVTESTPVVRETVVTTLPIGSRTRVYRGSSYYYAGDVVYRSHPRGGYTAVPRPW